MLTPLTETAHRFVHSPQIHNIGGKAIPSRDGATQEVFDPSTGAVLTSVAMGSAHEVNLAVQAAQAAFPRWARISPAERAVLLHRFADALEKHATDLVQIESLDVGKAITAAEGFDIPFGISCVRYFADLLQHLTLDIPHALPRIEARTHRTPYGVCGFIFPWNFPYNLLLWNIVPALAAGNTVVVKPSELTPLSTLFVAQLAQEAGIPEGVINIVVGDGAAGQALAEHAAIRRMSFTGSPRVGKLIGEICGRNLVPVKLELGGKGAAVVFDDADLDATAAQLAGAITFNTGQVCCTATRWILHEAVHDKLVEKTISLLNSTRLGPALDRGTQMGPLVSKVHLERVSNHLDKGRAEGAEMLLQPKAAAPSGFEHGYYMAPSLLTGDPGNVCCREEIFGPSAFVLKFREEAEAVRLVNSLAYGLANSVWSADLERAARVAEQMIAGNSWINAHNVFAYGLPYRAVNLSGLGGGVNSSETLLDYLRPQTIARPLA
jgi:acyl-CoA reductase-like NAD-dependent aldehyde dehydrogenase